MPGCREFFFKVIKHFHCINDLYGHASHKNFYPRGHKIYNFGRPFLNCSSLLYLICPIYSVAYFCHHLSDNYTMYVEICHHRSMPGCREENFLSNAFLLCITAPGVLKFKIMVDPSLVIITFYLESRIYSWK